MEVIMFFEGLIVGLFIVAVGLFIGANLALIVAAMFFGLKRIEEMMYLNLSEQDAFSETVLPQK